MPAAKGQTGWERRNYVLCGRHLSNVIELSVFGGDAGCRYHYCIGAFTHTLRWDGTGCAALVTQCILMEAFTHWVTSAAHPIPAQRVCECTLTVCLHFAHSIPDGCNDLQLQLASVVHLFTVQWKVCRLHCVSDIEWLINNNEHHQVVVVVGRRGVSRVIRRELNGFWGRRRASRWKTQSASRHVTWPRGDLELETDGGQAGRGINRDSYLGLREPLDWKNKCQLTPTDPRDDPRHAKSLDADCD